MAFFHTHVEYQRKQIQYLTLKIEFQLNIQKIKIKSGEINLEYEISRV